ncbi:uncharacterized protein PAE49_009755 [Odontesthes bonariensis]|uniref:uncharacterized protein LOC142388690 n=1 Tax=Odontesthes bonariensis TaxID=219752 RepID=UPI003F5822C0
MSVPFSNTHLRVPRGFGTILEGLAREVLRDQPEDIPAFAAQYFDALLKQREESGMDPADWTAKLEDRFYNNPVFKNTETSPDKETAPEMTISKDKSYESQTEDESSNLDEASILSTTQPHASEKADSTESTDREEEEEEENNIAEKLAGSAEIGLSERKYVADILSNEDNGTDKEKDPTITTLGQVDRPDMKIDSNPVPDQNVPQSDSDPTGLLTVRGAANVDVCAQELGVTKAEGCDQQGSASLDEEIAESQVNVTEVAELVEIFPHSGLADVDVCAAELGGIEKTMEAETVQEDSHVVEEEESLKHQVEETFEQSLQPQNEVMQGSQQEAEDQVEKGKQKEKTETDSSCGETNESLAHIEGASDDDILPKEDSLVEISFEDVPKAQCITAVGEKPPEEEASNDALQTNILKTQPMEDPKELTASSTDQDVSDLENQVQPEMEIEMEFDAEEQGTESHHPAFDILKEKVDTNDSHLNYSDDGEKEKGVKNISSSDQPTSEEEKEIQENEARYKSEEIEEIRDDKFHQNQEYEKETQPNDSDFKEDETTDTGGGDEELCSESYSEMGHQKMNDGGWEYNPSQVTQSNTSVAGIDEESETFEESSQHEPQENEEIQRTVGVSQPEDTMEEKQVTSKKAEGHTEETTDCEEQERSKAMENEEAISLSQSADCRTAGHQEAERPAESEKDTTELASQSDKVIFFLSILHKKDQLHRISHQMSIST